MALYAFDGTWNKEDTDGDGLDENTNVYNFLRYYAPGDPEAREKRDEYIPGVGTRHGTPGRIVGGFFGAGGRGRVEAMVESFKRNWQRNGPEDRTVDVIGFSRGGALALHFCNALARGVEINGNVERPEIRFLGLWDVVPSFGLPGVGSGVAHSINIGWDLEVPDAVQKCFHAMALEERRGAFDVHRLDPEHDDTAQIQEWWFRGVHSDVGGGNGNVDRTNISLQWMLQNAHDYQLPIDIAETKKLKFDLAAEIRHHEDQGRSQDRLVLKGDSIHPSAGRKLAVGEEVIVEVDSRLRFDFSGILLEEGAQYLFQPDPNGRWTDKTIVCDASGWPNDLNRDKTVRGWIMERVLESHLVGLTRRVPGANWFEMIACVDSCAKPAIAIGHGQYATTPWVCTKSGSLFFFANDARLHGFGQDFYENNKGAINVKVKRVA